MKLEYARGSIVIKHFDRIQRVVVQVEPGQAAIGRPISDSSDGLDLVSKAFGEDT